MSAPPRLWVAPEALEGPALTLTGDDYHYLFRVLRLASGGEVALFDGRGRQATARIEEVGPDRATLRVDAARPVEVSSGPRVVVMLPLIKGDRMDWCIQKLVELGARRIIPVRTSRCVVRLSGERAANRRQRWLTIARDAARQSRTDLVPEIDAVTDLDDAISKQGDAPLKLVFWERVQDRSLRAALPDEPPSSVAILLGPEGGLGPEEVDRAVEAGFLPVGLGPRVLRAETAAVAAVAALGFALGDLG